MALTQIYVDPAINANSGTGTIGDAYGDLEYCLATDHHDAVNGTQINVKVGTAEVLSASLNLAAHYGAGGMPSSGAPLVIRGYTAAANDGGRAEINCGGFTFWATNYSYFALIDLQMHTFGNNNGVNLGNSNPTLMCRCEVHKGSSSPGGKYLVSCASATGQIVGCYIHDAGTSGIGIYTNNTSRVIGNYVVNCPTGLSIGHGLACANVVYTATNGNGIVSGAGIRPIVIGNAVYSAAGGTGAGISLYSGPTFGSVINNIVCGFSGVGGVGIYSNGDNAVIGHNAFYNCTTPTSYLADTLASLGGDVTLLADPFTNAAAGDFSLTAAAKTALRGVGWPAAYLGAHANTDGHITIGAIQYGEAEAGGAGVFRRAMRMIGG